MKTTVWPGPTEAGTTPLVFEASPLRPAWVDYSGPHYFYVPKGTREVLVDADPRLSVVIPGGGKPGETLKVKFIGDILGDFERDITLPAAGDRPGRVRTR